MWFTWSNGFTAMSVTPAMMNPIATTTSISSNENPRFVDDVITSFGEEEKLADAIRSVKRCQPSEGRICRAANSAGLAFLDGVTDHPREGVGVRQSTRGQYWALAFRSVSGYSCAVLTRCELATRVRLERDKGNL